MNWNWHRRPLGPVQGLIGVLCWGLVTTAVGCSADDRRTDGAGGSNAEAPEATGDAVPWGPGEDCRPWGCGENAASNSIITPPVNATTCTSTTDCGGGPCVDGVCCDAPCTGTCEACTNAKKGQGNDGECGPIALYGDPDNECFRGACSGTGQCQSYNGVACGDTPDCLSGNCVDGFCCGNACTGSCMACSAAKRGGGVNGQCGPIATNTDPDAECGNGTCNGSGACSSADIGTQCSSDAQCASGHCVDSVCCDTACTDTCNACSAAVKGQGTNGTCGPVAEKKNPGNKCAGGYCNGFGACVYLNGIACSSAAQCVSGYCVDDVCCGNSCTGSCMACTIAKRGGGHNGQCGPIVSGNDPDDECGGAGVCNGNKACTMVDTGYGCSSDAECSSGHCIDSVCCDTACTGTCMACNVTGSVGTCTFAPQGDSDPNSTPVCGGVCDGQGNCQSNSGSDCTSGIQCTSHICDDEKCANVGTPSAPLQWSTILSPTVSSTIDLESLVPTADGGISGSGTKSGTIDLNGWMLDSGPGYSQPWSFVFDASGSPTAVSDSATNDATNTTTYFRVRARYDEIVAATHVSTDTGSSVSTMTVTAPGWNRAYDNAQVTGVIAGDSGHLLLAAKVLPDSPNGVDFGDGNLVTGDRLVKYDPSGNVQINVAASLPSETYIAPSGELYDISRQTGSVTIVKRNNVGNHMWTKNVAMTLGGGASATINVVFDDNGDLLLSFNFTGDVDFGNGAMTALGTNDLGLAKLDPSGNPLWTTHFGTSNFNLTAAFMEFTSTDDMVVVGYFQGTANLGDGDFTGGRFLAKFDETGTLVWRTAPPSGFPYGLTGSPSGAVFVSATSQTIDFGWGTPLSGTGGLIIVKYDN